MLKRFIFAIELVSLITVCSCQSEASGFGTKLEKYIHALQNRDLNAYQYTCLEDEKDIEAFRKLLSNLPLPTEPASVRVTRVRGFNTIWKGAYVNCIVSVHGKKAEVMVCFRKQDSDFRIYSAFDVLNTLVRLAPSNEP